MALENQYQIYPDIAIIMKRDPTGLIDINNLEFEGTPDDALLKAVGTEMAWHFVQVLFFGFVSTSLTEQLITREKYEAQNNADSETSEADDDSGTEDEFLGRLSCGIRKRIMVFVTRARQLRSGPEQSKPPSQSTGQGYGVVQFPREIKR